MKRSLYKKLLEWKNSKLRKPLLLQGARQVGKTYLVTQFAKKEYSDFVYLNFEQDKELKTLFSGSLKAQTLIENISLYLGRKIHADKTLIFFDEIQIVPEVLTSLKYFHEQTPEYHIIAAGSLLGVSLGKQNAFPVGKVNFLTLYPMNFFEYLNALGKNKLSEMLASKGDLCSLPDIIHEKLLSLLKMYLFLGGMPEVLKNYREQNDIVLARQIQNEILEAYKRDFSKYTDKRQAIKTSEYWRSVPYQLAKENKKFKYSDIKKNARASTFEQTTQWLQNAGLIHTAFLIHSPKIPLSGYADYNAFKVYLLDNGLLGAMLNLHSDIIIKPNEFFREYNGAFIENFTATELVNAGQHELFYWKSKSDAEIDFILENDNHVYPLEIKSGMNRNKKSLKSYADKYKPYQLLRSSPRNFTRDGDFINIPLYAVSTIRNYLKM